MNADEYRINDGIKAMIEKLTVRHNKDIADAPYLMFLAENVFKKPVTVYDLETTSMINDPNFGITEVAMLHFFPGNGVYSTTTLCNPRFPISPIVTEKTGITDDMVKDAPPWEKLGGPLFHYLTCLGHVFIGYNNFTFDRKCVLLANKKNNFPGLTPPEEQELDIFPIAAKHMGRWPKLGALAEALGIKVQGQLHRALADVTVTAGVIDRLGQEYGLQGLRMKTYGKKNSNIAGEEAASPASPPVETGEPVEAPVPPAQYKNTGSNNGKGTKKAEVHLSPIIQAYMASEAPDKSVPALRSHMKTKVDEKALRGFDFALAELLDTGKLKISSLDFDESVIGKGMAILTGNVIEKTWSENGGRGRLKPLLDIVHAAGGNGFTYIDIRECLVRSNYRWSTLKVNLTEVVEPGGRNSWRYRGQVTPAHAEEQYDTDYDELTAISF